MRISVIPKFCEKVPEFLAAPHLTQLKLKT